MTLRIGDEIPTTQLNKRKETIAMADKTDFLGKVWALIYELLELVRKMFKNSANKDNDNNTDPSEV